MEEVSDGRVVKDQILRDALATMLFRGDDIYKPMGLLSGGERARVALVELLLDKPNVLLLDEPTNHLDINSREALENSLADYPGTILCVSHDRYFLDKTVRRLFILDPPNVRDFDGGYRDYLNKLSNAKRPQVEKEKSRPTPAPQPSRKSVSKRDDNPYARKFGRLTVEQLERQISQTEASIAEMDQKFADTDAFRDAGKSKAMREKYEEMTRQLAELEEEYFTRGVS